MTGLFAEFERGMIRERVGASFQEGIAAYRLALEERTRERAPLDWARTQNNLGPALAALGKRESRTARLEEAIAAYDACPYQKLDSAISVVQATQNCDCLDGHRLQRARLRLYQPAASCSQRA